MFIAIFYCLCWAFLYTTACDLLYALLNLRFDFSWNPKGVYHQKFTQLLGVYHQRFTKSFLRYFLKSKISTTSNHLNMQPQGGSKGDLILLNVNLNFFVTHGNIEIKEDFIGDNKKAIIISDEKPLGVPKRFHIHHRR